MLCAAAEIDSSIWFLLPFWLREPAKKHQSRKEKKSPQKRHKVMTTRAGLLESYTQTKPRSTGGRTNWDGNTQTQQTRSSRFGLWQRLRPPEIHRQIHDGWKEMVKISLLLVSQQSFISCTHQSLYRHRSSSWKRFNLRRQRLILRACRSPDHTHAARRFLCTFAGRRLETWEART